MLPNISIDPKEQIQILQQLDKAFSNEKLDFSEQLRTLYKAQVDLVEKYGRDGFLLLLDYETRVYEDTDINRSLEIMHYSDVPENCPWYHQLHLLPLDQAIRKIWELFPIDFVNELEKHCLDLFAIFEDDKWYLAYAYQSKDYEDNLYYEFLGGRQPEPTAKLSKELVKAGWKMPKDLQELYSVHGNFGRLKSALQNDIAHCIPNAEKLEASLTFLEEYVTEWEVDYTFFDLLPFCEDGAGNSQNFYKAMPTDDSYMTVDWDHETKEISGGSILSDFIDFQFGEKLAERN